LLGQQVLELYQGWLPAGVHRFALTVSSLSAGTYWLVLEGGRERRGQRLTVLPF